LKSDKRTEEITLRLQNRPIDVDQIRERTWSNVGQSKCRRKPFFICSIICSSRGIEDPLGFRKESRIIILESWYSNKRKCCLL